MNTDMLRPLLHNGSVLRALLLAGAAVALDVAGQGPRIYLAITVYAIAQAYAVTRREAQDLDQGRHRHRAATR